MGTLSLCSYQGTFSLCIHTRKKKLDSAQSSSMMAYSFLVIAGKKNFQRLGKDADDIVVYFFGIISEPTGNG